MAGPGGINLQNVMAGASTDSQITAELRFTVDESSVLSSLNKMMEITEKQQHQIESLQTKMWETIFGRPQEQIQKMTETTSRMFSQMLKQISENVARGGVEAIDLIKDRLMQAAAEIPELSQKLYDAGLPASSRVAAMQAASYPGMTEGPGFYHAAMGGRGQAQQMMTVRQGVEGYHAQALSGGDSMPFPVKASEMGSVPGTAQQLAESAAMTSGAARMSMAEAAALSAIVGSRPGDIEIGQFGPSTARGAPGGFGAGQAREGIEANQFYGRGGPQGNAEAYWQGISHGPPFGSQDIWAPPSPAGRPQTYSQIMEGYGHKAAGAMGSKGAEFLKTQASKIPMVGGLASRGVGVLGAAAGPVGLVAGVGLATIAIDDYLNSVRNAEEAFKRQAMVTGQSVESMRAVNSSMSALSATTFLTAQEIGALGGGLISSGLKGGNLLGNLSAGASMVSSFGVGADTAVGMLTTGRQMGMGASQVSNLSLQAQLGAQFTNMSPEAMHSIQATGMQMAQQHGMGNVAIDLSRQLPIALSGRSTPDGLEVMRIPGLSENSAAQSTMLNWISQPRNRSHLLAYSNGNSLETTEDYMNAINAMSIDQLRGLDDDPLGFEHAVMGTPIAQMMGGDMTVLQSMAEFANKGEGPLQPKTAIAIDKENKDRLTSSMVGVFDGVQKQGKGDRIGRALKGINVFQSEESKQKTQAKQSVWDRQTRLESLLGDKGKLPVQIRDLLTMTTAEGKLGMSDEIVSKMVLRDKAGKNIELGKYLTSSESSRQSVKMFTDLQKDLGDFSDIAGIGFEGAKGSVADFDEFLSDTGDASPGANKVIPGMPGFGTAGKSVNVGGITVTLAGDAARMFHLATITGEEEVGFSG